MSLSREESMRIAAEKVRLKKEKEAREEREFYERITRGTIWTLFKAVVVICTLILIITTIDIFWDGSSKSLTNNDCQTDRNWEYPWHKVLDIEGCMFTPTIDDWSDRDSTTLTLTYSPILQAPKKLSYDVKVSGIVLKEQVDFRQNSVFNWFPFFQIALLIPLVTYFFRRQSAWFNFARVASFVLIFPGSLLVIYFTIF